MLNPLTLSRAELLLRAGVAFAFFYPAISAWFNPYAWVGYFPPFVLDLAGSADTTLLHVFGVFEIVLGLWILFGRNIRIPTALAALALAAIVLFNWTQMDVLFRDIPILLMAVVLMILNTRRGLRTS